LPAPITDDGTIPPWGLMRTGRGSDGQLFRQIYELPLTRSQLPLFTLTWTLMHSIGTASPLLGTTPRG
jgi:inward rectifier potassium channel